MKEIVHSYISPANFTDDKSVKDDKDKEKKHKRTKTAQYTFVKSTRKNTEKEVKTTNQILTSHNSLESTQEKEKDDAFANYFSVMNEEHIKNQEKKLQHKEAALQEKEERDKEAKDESSSKQLFLFYRTPSNKDNKKVLFKDK